MKPDIFFSFLIVCIAIVLTAGCTSTSDTAKNLATPSTQPVQQPVATVTGSTTTTLPPAVQAATAKAAVSANDKAFVDYIINQAIDTKINTMEMAANNGAFNLAQSSTINKLLQDSPIPDSPTLQKYRTTMMDTIGTVQGMSNDEKRFDAGLAKAEALLYEYSNETAIAAGRTLATPAPPQVKLVLSKLSDGTNQVQITNEMSTSQSFTVSYDVYNGEIKSSNEEKSTPILSSGESALVMLTCPSTCTGITLSKVQLQNQSTFGMEDVVVTVGTASPT